MELIYVRVFLLHISQVTTKKIQFSTYRRGGLRRGGDLPRGGNISRPPPYMSRLKWPNKLITKVNGHTQNTPTLPTTVHISPEISKLKLQSQGLVVACFSCQWTLNQEKSGISHTFTTSMGLISNKQQCMVNSIGPSNNNYKKSQNLNMSLEAPQPLKLYWALTLPWSIKKCLTLSYQNLIAAAKLIYGFL